MRRFRDLVLRVVLPVLLWWTVWVPRPVLSAVATVMGDLYRLGATRERRILERNLERVLGIEARSPDGRRFARAVFRHQVAAVLEAVRGIYRPESIVVEGLGDLRVAFERLEEAADRENGAGVIFVTAHLGAWELFGSWVAAATWGEFHELAKPSRIEPTNRVLEAVRRQAGSHVLWTGRRALLREMIEILRSGHTLGLAIDQKPEGLRGPVVDFFAQPTEFVFGPASLAVRTKSALIAGFCIRLRAFQYRIFVHEVLPAGHDEQDAEALTQRLATLTQTAIERAPEQWPWNYRRWVFPDEQWTSARGRKARREDDSETSS